MCVFVQVLDEMQRDLRRRTEEEIAHLQEVALHLVHPLLSADIREDIDPEPQA